MAPFKSAFKQCLLLIQGAAPITSVRNITSRLRMKSRAMTTWSTGQFEAIERKRLQSFIKSKQHMVAQQRDHTVEEFKDRLDDLHYKSNDFQARKYNRTWNDFADDAAKKKRRFVYQKDQIPPTRRRKIEERPSTAKPWDNDARQFISQLDVRTPLTNLTKKQVPPVAPPVTKYPTNRFESHITYDGKPQHHYY